jgi:hypothetical protein
MNNSTVVFPLPLDIVRPFVDALGSVVRDAPGSSEDAALEGSPQPEITEATDAALPNGADRPVTAGTPAS